MSGIVSTLDPRYAILCADARHILPIFDDQSVDLIVTDPPYSVLTHTNLGAESRGDGYSNRAALSFDGLSVDDIKWYAEQFVRLARGWVLVFTDERSLGCWGSSFEAAGGRWVRTGYWVKNNPMPQMSGDRPGVGTEPFMIGHTGKRMTWRGGGRAALWRGGIERGDARVHPTQKPAWLMQEIVGMFSHPGQMVLDPFAGSGSTLAAALSTERFHGLNQVMCNCKPISETPMPEDMFAIGIERDPRFAALAGQRLRSLLTPAARP